MACTFAHQNARTAVVFRSTGRRHRLHVACIGSTSPAPSQQREEQRSRTVPQSLASGLQMHSPTGPTLASWISMLELFFAPRKDTSWSMAEISDFNFDGDNDEDDAPRHMYTSHLADRLAMQSLERDEE